MHRAAAAHFFRLFGLAAHILENAAEQIVEWPSCLWHRGRWLRFFDRFAAHSLENIAEHIAVGRLNDARHRRFLFNARRFLVDARRRHFFVDAQRRLLLNAQVGLLGAQLRQRRRRRRRWQRRRHRRWQRLCDATRRCRCCCCRCCCRCRRFSFYGCGALCLRLAARNGGA